MARPERFELPTYSSGGCRSIQLSYGRVASVYMGGNAPSNERRSKRKQIAACSARTETTVTQCDRRKAQSAVAAVAASASGAFGFGTGFIHIDGASAQLRTVQPGDGLLALFGVRHFNESEPARTASVAIGENADAIHLTIGFKGFA